MVLSSCQPALQEESVFTADELIGLASPIQLEVTETQVVLTDYFIHPENITSVTADGVEVEFDKVSSTATLKGQLSSALGVLEVKTTQGEYQIPLLASSKMATGFSIPVSELNAKELKVKGTFNSWNPNDGVFKQIDENWVLDLVVNKGSYEYKLVADGAEIDDPTNPVKVSNGFGGFNNILQVGAKPVNNLLSTSSFLNSEVVLNSEIGVDEAIATLNNSELLTEIKGQNIHIKLPKSQSSGFSSLRVWAAHEGQLTNDVHIPLYNGAVLTDASQLPREDMRAAIMYFVMIDRFNDGNEQNNLPIDDDRILPIANNLGGDMTGVTQKINEGYFDELGINTLWLSPITTNPDSAYGLWNKEVTSMFSGYHGYWPVKSKEIDHRLGSSEAFKELISKSHEGDMNVLLDYVANHVHIEHSVYQQHPEWATDLYLPDGTMNTEKWDEHRLTTWFDTHLATLDLRRPEVINPMVDTAMFWLQNYELDGFRHDATKHIDELFWRTLTKRIKTEIIEEENRPIYQVGETYGSPELVSSYVESGQLDAQFDFNLYDAALDAFAKKETGFENLERVLSESLKYHGAHHTMVNITGNQDKPRFASLADGSVKFDEDTKLAGWTRDIQNRGESGFLRLQMMTAFLHAVPGIPCVYYGDEIGMPGGNDPDNRRMMQFENLNQNQKETLENLKALTELRTSHLALIYGSTEIIEASQNMLRIKRSYFDQEIEFIFYKGSEILDFSVEDSKSVNILYSKRTEIREKDTKKVFSMEPHSFVILETKN